jgi:hypothetical protein
MALRVKAFADNNSEFVLSVCLTPLDCFFGLLDSYIVSQDAVRPRTFFDVKAV